MKRILILISLLIFIFQAYSYPFGNTPMGDEKHKIVNFDDLEMMKLGVRTLTRLNPNAARIVQGTMDSDQTWSRSSHIRVRGQLWIKSGVTLHIEPGVRISLDEGASIYVEGTLVARGSKESPILFTASETTTPWAHIQFPTASKTEYDDQGRFTSGSIIEWAVVEFGGNAPIIEGRSDIGEEAGMIQINGSAPFFNHVIFRNGKSKNGGAIALSANAAPVVQFCEFSNNIAKGNGGAAYMFLNSAGKFENCLFLNNRAGRDGGAMYVSYGTTEIIGNVFQGNTAGRDGGALHMSGAAPVLRDNLFRNNDAENSGDIVALGKCTPLIRGNSFFAGEAQTALVPLGDWGKNSTLDLSDNYWGSSEETVLDQLFYVRMGDPKLPTIRIAPYLQSIPDHFVLQPTHTSNFRLYLNDRSNDLYPFDYIGIETRINLEVLGKGSSSKLVELLPLTIASSSGDTLHLYLEETSMSSGIFQGSFEAALGHITDRQVVSAFPGDNLTIYPLANKALAKNFPVRLQKPLLTNLNFDREDSLMRRSNINLPVRNLANSRIARGSVRHFLTNHLYFQFDYYEPMQRHQTALRFRLKDDSGEVLLESGVIRQSKPLYLQYVESLLKPGGKYTLEVDATQGIAWSNPAKITFVQNSVPGAPEFVIPTEYQSLASLLPRFSVKSEPDNEGDPLWVQYEISLEDDRDSRGTLSRWELMNNRASGWQFDEGLADNTRYRVRARLSDGMNASPKNNWQPFAANLRNDPPGDFEILHPLPNEEITYSNSLSWTQSIDIDPYDEVKYEVYANNVRMETNSTSLTFAELEGFTDLPDNTDIKLQVRAVDKYGTAVSASNSGGMIYLNIINDPPGFPTGFNIDEFDRLRDYPPVLTFNSAIDPDHSDSASTLQYKLRMEADRGKDYKYTTTPGDTSIVLEKVKDNTEYSMMIMTIDDDGLESGWSEAKIVVIDSLPEPPDPFDLLSPGNQSITYNLEARTFSWEATNDPDPRDEVSYNFMLWTSPDFSTGEALVQHETLETEYIHEGRLEPETDYYWIVQAVDRTGNVTWSDTWSFRIETTPSVPTWSANMGGEVSANSLLSWNASTDPDPTDIVRYSVQIATSAGFNGADVVTVDNVGNVQLALDKIPSVEQLPDNSQAWFRVKAIDNHDITSDWSSPQKLYMNYKNDPPSIPSPIAPLQGRVSAENSEFTWRASKDPDHSDPSSSLVYELMFTDENGTSESFTTSPGATLFTPRQLRDNNTYTWKIRAKDDEGLTSGWSSEARIIMDAANEAPSAPVLVQPANASTPYSLKEMTFTWQASSDPDPGSTVRYVIEVAKTPQFINPVFSQQMGITNYTYRGKLENQVDYYWRVKAVDNTDLEGISNSRSFRIDTTPTVPQFTSAAPAELTISTRISWQASNDPDPNDKLTYTLQLSRTNRFNDGDVAQMRGIGALSVAMSSIPSINAQLQENSDVYYRVQAVDDNGVASEWSSIQQSHLNMQNDPPTTPALDSPNNGTLNTQTPRLNWQSSSDPDKSDAPGTISYEIQIADKLNRGNVKARGEVQNGTTSWSPDSPLPDNAEYVWRVRAKDSSGGTSGWSDYREFTVNVREDAPSDFNLVEPSNSGMVNVGDVINFRWQAAKDPDIGSEIRYSVFVNGQSYGPFRGTSFKFNDRLTVGKNVWYVVAEDNTGLKTKSDEWSLVIREVEEN
ncbi:hypothetical protein K8I28_08950 [bacterium]|nr:hypothetical protein [bacterium]